MPSSRFHPSLYSYMRVMRQPLFFLTKDRLQDSFSFIVEEKCVTSQTSKQAILSVCTKSRVHHHTIIYRQIALYSRQLLCLWTKLHNGIILVWKKKAFAGGCWGRHWVTPVGHRILLLGVSNHGNLLSSPPVSNTWEGWCDSKRDSACHGGCWIEHPAE